MTFDLDQAVVGADDELGGDGAAVGAGLQVSVIALDPRPGPGLGLQFPVQATCPFRLGPDT